MPGTHILVNMGSPAPLTVPLPSTITVPNNLSYLPPIQAFASALAADIGFPPQDVQKILLALEEAIVNVIEHAFDPGEAAMFHITLHPTSTGLEIVIRDKGLPFFQGEFPEYRKPGGLEELPPSGLGSLLMKSSMEKVVFHNRGKEGKELRLVKHLPFTSIFNLYKEHELAPYPAPDMSAPRPTGAPRAETEDFEIRLMRPEDCPEVSRLFYRCYGYTYGNDAMYYPEKYAQLLRDGLFISAVAETKGHEIVGHLALVRKDARERTAEVGWAAVRPDFRDRGFMNLMHAPLFEEAQKAGLPGIFAEAVTHHVFSQKVAVRFGFKNCGLVLGAGRADVSFKGIRPVLPQRQTYAYSFLPLADPPGIVLYPPAFHRQFIESIFRRMGLTRTFAEAGCATAPEEKSSIRTTLTPWHFRGLIEVERIGRDIATELKNTLKDLRLKKLEEIQLLVSLEDPLTAAYCEAIEAMGFFIAGVVPFSTVGDALVLQYYPDDLPMDYNHVQIFAQDAKEIFDYVKAHDPHLR
jgi:serine/threonine-protein kinase RsbW